MAHVLKKQWRSDDIKVKPKEGEKRLTFDNQISSEELKSGLREAGFKLPSPVQVLTVPVGRSGNDLIVQAKSGTGKTCAFTIIILERLTKDRRLQALIVTPTREIAVQIQQVIKTIGCFFPNLSCETFIGGTPVEEDISKLNDCQIAVGTPGRIRHLIEDQFLLTDLIGILVMDEADTLLNSSFLDDVDYIHTHLPVNKQVLAVSATFQYESPKRLQAYMCNPRHIKISKKEIALKGVHQFCHIMEYDDNPTVAYEQKLDVLWDLIHTVSFRQCMVFCSSLTNVELVGRYLEKRDYPADKICSMDKQDKRQCTIDKLKKFEIKVLVSSDLTARGIDAEHVNFIINMDLAIDLETYIHRIGRAGRFGSKGVSISIITNEKETMRLLKYQRVGNFQVFLLPDPVPYYLLKYEDSLIDLADAVAHLQQQSGIVHSTSGPKVRKRKNNGNPELQDVDSDHTETKNGFVTETLAIQVEAPHVTIDAFVDSEQTEDSTTVNDEVECEKRDEVCDRNTLEHFLSDTPEDTSCSDKCNEEYIIVENDCISKDCLIYGILENDCKQDAEFIEDPGFAGSTSTVEQTLCPIPDSIVIINENDEIFKNEGVSLISDYSDSVESEIEHTATSCVLPSSTHEHVSDFQHPPESEISTSCFFPAFSFEKFSSDLSFPKVKSIEVSQETEYSVNGGELNVKSDDIPYEQDLENGIAENSSDISLNNCDNNCDEQAINDYDQQKAINDCDDLLNENILADVMIATERKSGQQKVDGCLGDARSVKKIAEANGNEEVMFLYDRVAKSSTNNKGIELINIECSEPKDSVSLIEELTRQLVEKIKKLTYISGTNPKPETLHSPGQDVEKNIVSGNIMAHAGEENDLPPGLEPVEDLPLESNTDEDDYYEGEYDYFEEEYLQGPDCPEKDRQMEKIERCLPPSKPGKKVRHQSSKKCLWCDLCAKRERNRANSSEKCRQCGKFRTEQVRNPTDSSVKCRQCGKFRIEQGRNPTDSSVKCQRCGKQQRSKCGRNSLERPPYSAATPFIQSNPSGFSVLPAFLMNQSHPVDYGRFLHEALLMTLNRQ